MAVIRTLARTLLRAMRAVVWALLLATAFGATAFVSITLGPGPGFTLVCATVLLAIGVYLARDAVSNKTEMRRG